MWHRALVTAFALTYLICVLSLSGVQKEDLDVNTLKKLKQHNVNLDDLNNETLHRDCLANTEVELSSNKQTASAELATTSLHPVVTESTFRNSKRLKVTEVPDIENVIKYFKTAPGQAVRRVNIEVHGAMLNDVRKGDSATTTVAPTTTVGNIVDNSSLMNPENLIKFWSMYANFQQSQKQLKKIQNEPTTTSPEVKLRTEKNNIFHITINKYTRNESFLEHYFDTHNNKTAEIKRTELASNNIMEKIHDFISNKLFANDDEPSKEDSKKYLQVSRRENPTNKAIHGQGDVQSVRSGTESIDDENTKTVLSKIPPQTLDDIAKEVQDLVLRGLIKSKTNPPSVTPKISTNAEKGTAKIPRKLLQSVVDNVKKMLLSELWKDSGSNGSETIPKAKNDTTTVATNQPESIDPELSNFIKLFKKFKSWKETVKSSSKEDPESAKVTDQLKHTKATYKSYGTYKNKGKLTAVRSDNVKSVELNDSSTYSDQINSYGYSSYHEKNVIAEDENQQTENYSNLAQFPLPYRAFQSGNKHVKINTNVDSSIEGTHLNQPVSLPQIETINRRLKNKHTRHKSSHRSQKKLKENLNSISIETKHDFKNTSPENNFEDNLELNTHVKSNAYNNVASEYLTNNNNEDVHDEESFSSERKGNSERESVLNTASKENKKRKSHFPKHPASKGLKSNDSYGYRQNYSPKNIDAEEGNKIASNLNAQFKVGNPYVSPENLDQHIMTNAKTLNTLTPNYFATNSLHDNAPGFQDEGRNQNIRPGHNAYMLQSYPKNSRTQEQISNLLEHNPDVLSVHTLNSDQNKDESNQGLLRNNPRESIDSYGVPGYLSRNKLSGNVPNDNQMTPYPYDIPNPNYSINSKSEGAQHFPDTPKTYVRTAFNTYDQSNHPFVNNIAPQQHNIRGIEVNHIPEKGYPAALNYSKRNNIGDNQYQIHVGTNTENVNYNVYQEAPNYSSQNKFGSIQEQTSGNIPILNSIAPYPYVSLQYHDKNKPRGISDPRTVPIDISNSPASYNMYSAPNDAVNNNIGGIQGQIQAAPIKNANIALANPFGGIFAAKEKFPVIQDPRVEALMKTVQLNTGPSFSPFASTGNQGPMRDLQNTNMRKNPNIVAQSLVPNILNEANNRVISVQRSQPLPYGEIPDIVAPSMILNSMSGVSIPKLDNIKRESLMVRNNPYVNAQPVTLPAYTAQQQPDLTALPPSDVNFPKQKVTQNEPRKIENNSFNTIAKIYPHSSTQKKIKDDQTSPIMIQTNDDEIMPLGIPIHIRSESKFHMRLIQNQHIIVTTTARPKSRAKDWNDYRLSKDARGNVEEKKPMYSQPSTSYHQERVRPPMTHHDFEDDQQNIEPRERSQYYHDELIGMRPRSEHEFESRHLYQNVPESMPAKRPRYIPDIDEGRYPRHRYEKPVKGSLYREQEKMHDSINTGQLTIAQRHQIPLKRPQMNFDDTHFNNFLKTQEKVNEMLERILATRPKNLSLEPIKGD